MKNKMVKVRVWWKPHMRCRICNKAIAYTINGALYCITCEMESLAAAIGDKVLADIKLQNALEELRRGT